MNTRDEDQKKRHPAGRPEVGDRPCLRLVSRDTQKDEDARERPGLNNPLVKFMSAYADAIDREVKTILDL